MMEDKQFIDLYLEKGSVFESEIAGDIGGVYLEVVLHHEDKFYRTVLTQEWGERIAEAFFVVENIVEVFPYLTVDIKYSTDPYTEHSDEVTETVVGGKYQVMTSHVDKFSLGEMVTLLNAVDGVGTFSNGDKEDYLVLSEVRLVSRVSDMGIDDDESSPTYGKLVKGGQGIVR